jgi:hypothetical protein
LADPHLLALITLQPPYGRAILDRRFADRSGNVAWHVRDVHEHRGRVRDGLEQPHPTLGEREHERGLRERHRPHQRLDVQPLAPDGQLNQPVGQPEGAQPGRGGKYRERSGLAAPKGVVLPEVGQRLLDGGEVVLVGPGQLVECGPGQVLERDLLRLAR